MTRILALVAVSMFGGCNDAGDHNPPGTPSFPGGGGPTGGGTSSPDGAVRGPDAATGVIAGTVCRRTTVAPQSCVALTGAGGLLITFREANTTTTVADDGTFSIPGAPGSAKATLVTALDNPVWFGGAVSISLETNGGGRANIPVLSQDDATLLAGNAGGLASGTGILVVHTGTGITVGDGAAIVYYDTGDEPSLSTTPPTGASGTAVVFGVAGAQSVTLMQGTTTVPVSADVFGGAATFLEAPF